MMKIIKDNFKINVIFILIYIFAPIQLQIYEFPYILGVFAWGRISLNPSYTYFKPFYLLNPMEIGYFNPNLGYLIYCFIFLMNINLILNLILISLKYKMKAVNLIGKLSFIELIITVILLLIIPLGYIFYLSILVKCIDAFIIGVMMVIVPPFNMTTFGLIYKLDIQLS